MVSWTVWERLCHKRSWTAPSASEAGAGPGRLTMVRNLLAERLPGLRGEDMYREELGARPR